MNVTYIGLVATIPARDVVAGDVLHYRKKSNYKIDRAERVEDEVHITVNVLGLPKPLRVEYTPDQYVHVLRPYRFTGLKEKNDS